MGDLDAEPIHAALADRLGTSLRAVIHYDATDVDSAMREDVEATYSDDEIRSLVDDSIVYQLEAPEIERSLRLGGMEAMVRSFERSWLVQVPNGRRRGCLFSVERDDGVSMVAVEDAVDLVRSELPD